MGLEPAEMLFHILSPQLKRWLTVKPENAWFVGRPRIYGPDEVGAAKDERLTNVN